ncbi:MAG TPA: hypothetical protein VFE24_18340 [Pirellulales bacterium]|jgi:hypothetical protein|nr:hypothetical protein [Pirellulales bacterium]
MSHHDLNRRDFNKLSAAAFGGLLGGTLAGCNKADLKADSKADPQGESKDPAAAEPVAAAKGTQVASAEGHLCRGINTCKNLGVSKKNDCAGQGDCATFRTHTCGGDNDCKGQGGCGPNPGLNDCKGKGGCSLPLHSGTWDKVRARFEEKMKLAGKPIGKAPPEKK